MPDDVLDAFKKVFGEFLRSEEYYHPKPETKEYLNDQDVPWSDVQKYIRDVYVSVITFGQGNDAYKMASAAKVFPRQEAPAKANEALAVTGSAAAQGQMAVEQQRGTMMRQAANVPEAQA